MLVFVFSLISESVIHFLPAPGYCVTLELKKKKWKWKKRKKSTTYWLLLNVPGWFCRSSVLLKAMGFGVHFYFVVVLLGSGLILGCNNHSCPVSSPHPQSTVWPALSTLRICTGLAPIIHLILHPFDQYVRCIDCEQITPILLLLLCWPGVSEVSACSPLEKSLYGRCCLSEPLLSPFDQSMSGSIYLHSSLFAILATAHVRCLQGSSVPFFEKSPLGCCLLLLTSTGFSTQSNSLTSPESIWVMASHGPSLLPAPGVTRLPNFSGTVPPSNHSPSLGMPPAACHLLPSYPPRDFIHPGLCCHGSDMSRLCEGREPLGCNH